MFNITPSEFLVIAMLALIVLGPERLPEMARNLGRLINKVRNLTSDLQDTVSTISDDPSMKPFKELGELATRPRQKLAQFAAEAEAEERADRIAREREEMDAAQREIEESRLATADSDREGEPTSANADASTSQDAPVPDDDPVSDVRDDGPVSELANGGEPLSDVPDDDPLGDDPDGGDPGPNDVRAADVTDDGGHDIQ